MYKLLVVEDDEVIAQAIKRHMESWGYEVVCTEDFKDVLQTFVEENPQLVLMDISLPFYNGFHWCDAIRGISKVPVIFISSVICGMNQIPLNIFVKPIFDMRELTHRFPDLYILTRVLRSVSI